MRVNYFLTSYLPDKKRGGERHFVDILEQAVLADTLGFDAVSVPEHHLVNILLVPAPLQLAVKISALTKTVDISTSIVVLPVRDMRVFAGEVVQADILCGGRLVLGVGRGAFGYELARLGTPLAETKLKFDESLDVLEALLYKEEVSWDGRYYQFDPITVMPRPARQIPLMVASMAPDSIRDYAARGYDVQTTPLQATHSVLLQQVNAFKEGRELARSTGRRQRLSLQRVIYLAKNDADAKQIGRLVYDYYKRFDNVYSGPGIVKNGMIEALPRSQSFEEMMENIIICTGPEMIDRLSQYAEIGIDEVIMSSGFGNPQPEMLDMMQRFSAEIMPHLRAIETAEALA